MISFIELVLNDHTIIFVIQAGTLADLQVVSAIISVSKSLYKYPIYVIVGYKTVKTKIRWYLRYNGVLC